MIEQLTEAQMAKCPEYVDKWVKIGLDTSECDFERARAAVVNVYKVAGCTPPELIVGPFNNPYEAALAEWVIGDMCKNKTEFKDEAELQQILKDRVAELLAQPKRPKISIANQIYGYQEYWLSYYDYFQTECGVDLEGKVDPLIELAKTCGWWTPLAGIALLQHKPLEIHRDDQNRLHNINGPAVKFRGSDHADVYAVHGVRVNRKVIDRTFTVQDIEKETNAEVRRVMIEIYGEGKYLIDVGAKLVNKDDYGELYLKELEGDEPLMMVKVVNSTPEPDGSYKDYWMRVDPNAYGGLKTAQAAVASTWRKRGDLKQLVFKKPSDYDPDVET